MIAKGYKTISNRTQYQQYCKALEDLLETRTNSGSVFNGDIELLTRLIEQWDDLHNTFTESDPISLLRSFMVEHNMLEEDLIKLLDVSNAYISNLLSYKQRLSTNDIVILSSHFKVTQHAFNRHYELNP